MKNKGLIWNLFVGISVFWIALVIAIVVANKGSSLSALLVVGGFLLMLYFWVMGIRGTLKNKKENSFDKKNLILWGKSILKGMGGLFALFVAGIVVILLFGKKEYIEYTDDSTQITIEDQKEDVEATVENNYEESVAETEEDSILEQPLPDEVIQVDSPMITTLMELGFTKEEASDIGEKLNSVGINEISDVTEGIGQGIDVLQSFVAYANNDKNMKFHFTVEERELYYVGYWDSDLYDSTKGGVLKQITDVVVL